MRKANWSVADDKTVAADVLRRACQGIVGGLEGLENRQMLALVVDWPMDRDPGDAFLVNDAADDEAGRWEQDGTLWPISGGATWVANRNGTANSAVNLDGSNDSISNGETFMPFIGGTASVSFWVKTTAVGNENPELAGGVLGSGGATPLKNIVYGFLDHTGRIGMWVPGDPPPNSTNAKAIVKSQLPINDGNWHHVAMTRSTETGRIEIWVDGFLHDFGIANTAVRPDEAATSIRDVGLVNHQTGRKFFQGQIDEFMIDVDEAIGQSTIASRFAPGGVVPAAVTNLTATYSGSRAVKLEWTPSANASYYEVWRKVAGSADPFTKDPVNALGSGFYATGLLPETNYEFYIVAVNPNAPTGTGESNHVTRATTPLAPAGSGDGLLGIYFDDDGGPSQGGDMTPYNSRGRIAARVDPVINFDWPGQPHPQIGGDTFTVTWRGQVQAQYNEPYTFFKRSDDGMIFEIEVAPGQWVGLADWDYQGKEAVPGLQMAVVNLVAGQKYNIRAEMFEGGGGAGADLYWQSPSTPVQIIPTQQLYAPPAGLPPAAPSGLAAASGTNTGEIRLTWADNSDNEVGFIILRSPTGQAGTFREIARAGGASEFIDRTFPGTTYFYQVRAFNFGGISDPSNTSSAQANPTLSGLLVNYYRGQFNTAAGNPTGTVLDTQVHPNVNIIWGGGGPSGAVGNDDFTSVFEGTLTIPAGQEGSYTFMTNTDDGSFIWIDGQLILNDPGYHWYANPEDRRYSSATEQCATVACATGVNLTAGAHTFRFRTFEGGGDAAAIMRWKKPDGTEEIIPASAFAQAQTIPKPNAPGAAPATNVFSRRLTVNWTDSNTEAAFFLERSTNPDFTGAQEIAQLGSNVTSYTDTDVQKDTTYYYRVRAANLGGYSAYTVTPGATGVKTLAVEPVSAAPTNLIAALRPGNQAVLEWKDNSINEITFQIERSVAGGAWEPLATVQQNVTRYTDTGLAPNVNYNYRVRAVNIDNINSDWSNEEDVVNTPGTITAPWTNEDIGEKNAQGVFTNPALPGSVFYENEEKQFVVTGGGSDIWDPRDRFHYLYQPVSGDFQVTARVVDMTNPPTDPWAKAGVMIRETTSPSSQHAFNAVTPGNQVHFQGRLKTDDPASTTDDVNSFNDGAPGGSQNFTGWVRLLRTGQLVQSFWSPDGITWTANGSRTYGNPETIGGTTYPADRLDNNVLVGLASTSHNNGALSSGIFTNFDLFILPAPTVAVTNVEATAVPGNKIAVSWDDSARGAGQGNFYAGFYKVMRSANGGAFEQVGGERPINQTTFLDSGLTPGVTYTYKVIPANNNGQAPDSNTDSATAATGTGGVLPTGWQTQDIGDATGSSNDGSVDFLDQPGEADDVFELNGGGSDIWGTTDEFRYVYKQFSGEFIITTRVVFQERTAEWTKSGLDVRESLAGNSKHIGIYATGDHDPEFSRRQTTDTNNVRPWGNENTDAPTWLRLVRQDTNPDPAVTSYIIRAYASRNGGVTWDQVGNGYTDPALPETVYVGLVASAVNDAEGQVSTAEFDNVSFVQGLPAPSVALTNVEATAVPGNKIAVSWDDSARGANQGNFYASSYRVLRSANGGPFEQVGGVRPISETTYLDSGLTAGTTYTYKVVAVNNTGVSPDSNVDGATSALGTTTLPGAWQTTDVGAVGTAGSVGFLDQPGEADDVFELNGGGADIWGTQDEFRYVYQQVTGDFTITTRVVFQERTAEWTKTGIDVRENLTTGSRHAGLFATGDHDPEFTRRRVATTGDSDNFRPYGNANTDAPVWLRVSRQGSTAAGGGTLLAWVSRDGVTWDPVDTDGNTPGHQGITDPNLPAQVYVGLAASAVNDAEVSTAEFDNVSLTQIPVGGIVLTGTAANDNWFIKKVGEQIHVWNNADGSGTSVSQHALGESLTLNGADGDDTVTIDMSGGDFNLGALTIAGDAGNDKVRMINGDGKTLTLGAVPTLNGKSLDIGTGDLKLTGTTLAAVDALLASARNGATRWQGPGIGTSSATTLTGLSPVQQAGDVLVKYSYNGDANGDGRVNADDYFRIDQGFLAQPANPTYFQGDYNYDNRVNADDYFLIDQAFLGQGAQLDSGSVAAVATSSTSSTAVVASEETTKKAAKRRSSGDSLFSSKRIEKRGARSRR